MKPPPPAPETLPPEDPEIALGRLVDGVDPSPEEMLWAVSFFDRPACVQQTAEAAAMSPASQGVAHFEGAGLERMQALQGFRTEPARMLAVCSSMIAADSRLTPVK